MNYLKSSLFGAMWCLLSVFPSAAVLVTAWRFPVPFVGYRSGPSHLGEVLFGVVFYLVLGGGVVLALLGAIAGSVAAWRIPDDVVKRRRTTFVASVALGFACAFLLAILDKIIGPW